MRRKVRENREKDSVLKLTECKDFGILSFLLFIAIKVKDVVSSFTTMTTKHFSDLRAWFLLALQFYFWYSMASTGSNWNSVW